MYPFGDNLLLTDVASRLPQDARPFVKKLALNYYDSIHNKLDSSPVVIMVLAPKYQNSKISIGFGYSQKTDSSNEGLKNYNSITYYTIYQENNIWKSADNSVVQSVKPICQVQKEGNIKIILTDNGCFGLSKSLRTIRSDFKGDGFSQQIDDILTPLATDYYSRIKLDLITKKPIISTNFITYISNTQAKITISTYDEEYINIIYNNNPPFSDNLNYKEATYTIKKTNGNWTYTFKQFN